MKIFVWLQRYAKREEKQIFSFFIEILFCPVRVGAVAALPLHIFLAGLFFLLSAGRLAPPAFRKGAVVPGLSVPSLQQGEARGPDPLAASPETPLLQRGAFPAARRRPPFVRSPVPGLGITAVREANDEKNAGVVVTNLLFTPKKVKAILKM